MTEETDASRFPPLEWLVGEWRGYGRFTDRTSYIHKRFSYELGGAVLVERTLDIFPPSELTTDFEIHRDIVHYFRNGEVFEAIGFYVEGHVNLFSVTVAENPSQLTAETYEVRNIPKGMRAKVIYEQDGETGLRGEFLLAAPGESLETVEKLVMQRIS